MKYKLWAVILTMGTMGTTGMMGCATARPEASVKPASELVGENRDDESADERGKTNRDESWSSWWERVTSGDTGAAAMPENVTVAVEAEPAVLTLRLFVMSKCPYGVQAEQELLPIIEQFGGQLEVIVDYVGSIDMYGAVSTMHGDDERQGNIDQLCVRHVAGEAVYWDYLECVNHNWRSIPQNDVSCAADLGVDLGDFEQCRDSERGMGLLRESIKEAGRWGVVGSPSILIEGSKYSGLRNAMAVGRYICQKFGVDHQLDYCGTIPAVPLVKVMVINDKRCGEKCKTEPIIDSLKTRFLGLDAQYLDWGEPAVRTLVEELNITHLPAYVFDQSVLSDAATFESMKRWFTPNGDYYVLRAARASHDPRNELCENGVDDTGNGKVDCLDASCKTKMVCRKETKQTLELFVMSQCPFGAMAVLAMDEVLKAFAGELKFKIHFVGTVDDNGAVSSMHGAGEVAEDLRWMCAMKHYPKKQNYMKYIWCRAVDYRNEDWQRCATGPIKAKVLQKCVDSTNGMHLLRKNVSMVEELEIAASPTWVVNGRHTFTGVTPRAIQQGICRQNPKLKGCQTPLSDERISNVPAGACGQ